MIYVKSPTVFFNFPSGFIIQWSLEKTLEDVSSYTFTILTSTDPSIPFSIDGAVSNQFYYTHTVANRNFDPRLKYYYNITTTNTGTGESITTDMFYLQEDASGVALKIISQEQLFLANYIKRKGIFLIRKKNGKVCPRCFDTLKRRNGDPSCPICYGTGYLGGYYTPIPIYFQFIEPSQISQMGITNIGPMESNQLTAWMSNFPVATSNDMLIDTVTGLTYCISGVRGTSLGGALIRQILVLQQEEPSSGIYNFPIAILNTSTAAALATSTLPTRGL